MTDTLFLSTDLDRTLLPNGLQPESPDARPLFSSILAQSGVTLAYVSGRNLELVMQAIAEYAIPTPDYIIADVGSSIYVPRNDKWQRDEAWDGHISQDWGGQCGQELAELIGPISELTLQEQDKQQKYKLSYYASATLDTATLYSAIHEKLKKHAVHSNIIWSVDETSNTGLLDILPATAGKLHALRYLINERGFVDCLFAGDSGNDMEILCSELPAVLVANASDAVRRQALSLAEKNGNHDKLYCATGQLPYLNGNYSAGIVEGLLHFYPHTKAWLKQR